MTSCCLIYVFPLLFYSIFQKLMYFHNRIMIEDFEKNQAENPQEVCSLHFYYPTRENLSKYLKITKFSLENYDWIPPLYMQHQRNCKKLHPQINFDWFAKRDFRVQPKIVYLMCRDVFDYRCKARLVYQFDHDDQCFYLKDCNNQHYHILPGNAFFKVIWEQKKQKMQKLANETRGLQRREEQNERKEVQYGSKRIERGENRERQMMQKLRIQNKNRKKPQVIISKVFKK